MASFELISAVQDYEKYIEKNGINEQVIDVYCEAVNTAFANEKDIAYGLELSARCKEIIEAYCLNSSGGTIWDLKSTRFRKR